MTAAEDLGRRAWEAFNRRDFEALLELVHPEMEWRPAQGPGGVEGRVYRGKDEYSEWLHNELQEVWEGFRAEELEFRDVGGGRVVTTGYLVATGRGSGAHVRVPFSQLGWMRDGKIARIDAYLDHAGALAAAGVA